MNWADAYERISGTLKDLREAHAKTVTRNAELFAELAEVKADEHSACARANRLAQQTQDLERQLAATVIEATARITQLEGEIVRVRLISVLRGKIAEAWSEMLRESDAELARVKDELAEVLVNMEEAW